MAANKGVQADDLLNSVDQLGSLEEQEDLLRSLNGNSFSICRNNIVKKKHKPNFIKLCLRRE